MKKTIKTYKADEFKKESGDYVFPFVALDNPKDPMKSLGRIQWFVELHPANKKRGDPHLRIKEMWVWATQTRDPRYKGKIFKIETNAECMTTSSSLQKDDCYAPWRILFCDTHRGSVIMDAYPKNNHNVLVVNAWSSISVEVNFKQI